MIYDAVVIGGSYAGLSAAMMLARGRRSVLVLDSGLRRNRFANHSHGVLAQDGRPGSEIAEAAATQLAAYPNVRQADAVVTQVRGSDGMFLVQTEAGEEFGARKLLLATGVSDVLPPIPGLAERWGRSVFHCPYCHGYELGDGPIGVLMTSAASVSQAITLADWGQVTLFSNTMQPDQLDSLARRHVSIEDKALAGLEGPLDGPVQVRLSDGQERTIKGLFMASKQLVTPLAGALGCEIGETANGALIETNASKATSVPGVYAAGDSARLPSNVTLAAADGVLAGAAIHQALITADLERGS
jgi:thioredoxin reductase